MPDIGRSEILFKLLMMVLLVSIWAMVVAWGWLILRLFRGESILPERPLVNRAEPPWRAGTVFLVAFCYLAVSFLILSGYPLVADMLPASPALPLAIAPLSHLMLLNAAVDLVMLGIIPVVTRLTCGARLREFGLSFEGWWRQAAVGVVATLIVAPPVNAIQILATKIWTPQPHPVQEMLFKEFSVGVGGLAVLTAVCLAPLFEELAFRGLLQSWLVVLLNRRAARTPIAPVVDTPVHSPADDAPPTSYWQREPEAEPTNPYEPPRSVDSPEPLQFPADRPTSGAWRAIVLTSVLFAFVHAPQWPAPIALFVLAMVIGTIYHRTGSLIAAIFMHATFNGLSTLLLFIALLSGHQPEVAKLSAKDASEQLIDAKMGKKRLVAVSASCRSW